jgi:hypothetical protein
MVSMIARLRKRTMVMIRSRDRLGEPIQNHLLNSSTRERIHTLALTKVGLVHMLENVGA